MKRQEKRIFFSKNVRLLHERMQFLPQNGVWVEEVIEDDPEHKIKASSKKGGEQKSRRKKRKGLRTGIFCCATQTLPPRKWGWKMESCC